MAVPLGTIGIKKLVEMLVEVKHGPEAIAACTLTDGEEYTPFEMDGETHYQKQIIVSRAGIEIPKPEDDKRWDEARERVHGALLDGAIAAFTRLLNGKYDPSGSPVEFEPADWEHVLAWRTLASGEFVGPMDGGASNVRVLFDEDVALKWVAATSGSERDKTDVSVSKNKPNRYRAGRPAGPYVKSLKKFLKWWDKNGNRPDLDDEDLTTEALRRDAITWFSKHNVSGYPKSISQLRLMIDRLKVEVVAERNVSE